MPWQGNGQFNRTDGIRSGADVFAQQESANVQPTAPFFDAVSEDLATGLENCLTRDGQTTPSAATPWNNQKITGLANGTAAQDAATFGQVSSAAGQNVAASGVGGTGDAIELTPSSAITAYAFGQTFRFIVEAANTGAVTVAVSGLAAQSLAKGGTTALESGDLTVGQFVSIHYDGARFQLLSGTGGGTFTVSDLATTITALADTDEFVVADDSDVSDSNVKIAASNVKDYCLGDLNNVRVVSQTVYDGLTKDNNTLYLITGT